MKRVLKGNRELNNGEGSRDRDKPCDDLGQECSAEWKTTAKWVEQEMRKEYGQNRVNEEEGGVETEEGQLLFWP